ncbi:MAG: DUF3782 domain-containing protein [Candidatus Edwardsbacteria bacterium]
MDKTNDFNEIKESIKDLIERQKKTDEQLKKTDEQIRRTDRNVGNLTDGWGKFVEGLVEPSVPKLFSKLGIKIYGIYPRARKILNRRYLEIDVLGTGQRKDGREVVIVTEVKSELKQRDVDDVVETLNLFPKFFKEYKDREIIGAVAGIRLQKGIERYAERRGLYVLAPSGETMMILNEKGFKPKVWS